MQTLRKAPVKNRVEVAVTLATKADGQQWDREIRPIALQQHQGRTQFKWTRIFLLMPALRRIVFGWTAQKCYPLAVFTPGANDEAVLAGLMLVVEGVGSPFDNAQPCLYVWYLSSAPDAYLQARGVSLVPRAGEVLLDAAVLASIDAGFDGRVLLHAAPSGGQGLLDYYRGFGLESVPSSLSIPRVVGGQNDGRYFFANESTAQYIVRRSMRYR